MYKVTAAGEVVGSFPAVTWIRLSSSGVYIPCEEAEAAGICVKLPVHITTEDGEESAFLQDSVFALREGGLHGYEEVAEIELTSDSDLTPSERRENAYNEDAVIEWDGETITVTAAAQLWQYYAAEGSAKAEELTALISAAKAEIREKYPDGE